MSFVPNPLALSVPEAAFKAWLRDSGYLEILDSSSTVCLPSSSTPPPSKSFAAAIVGVASSVFLFLRTLVSLITANPFAKLTPEDFDGETPSWTLGFVGHAGSYSWPGGPSQARLRVQENVRRYARNYTVLCLIIFVCSLYHMPVPLLGLMASVALWELLRVCGDKWKLEEKCPVARTILHRVAQFAMLSILYISNLQLALFCALCVSYTVMVLHASLRKLAPSNPSLGTNQRKKLFQ